MDVQKTWSLVLDQIQRQISGPSFETWLKTTNAEKWQDKCLVISAPNDFARDWSESRYQDMVNTCLYHVTGDFSKKVCFITSDLVEPVHLSKTSQESMYDIVQRIESKLDFFLEKVNSIDLLQTPKTDPAKSHFYHLIKEIERLIENRVVTIEDVSKELQCLQEVFQKKDC